MTLLRWMYRSQLAFLVLIVGYGGLVLIPLNWFWYAAGEFAISDTETGVPAKIKYDRRILREVSISYTVVVRPVDGLTPVCDPKSGPFNYSPETKIRENIDMTWWANGDQRCIDIPPGDYLIQTTWTASNLVWGLLPPKSDHTPVVRYTVHERKPK